MPLDRLRGKLHGAAADSILLTVVKVVTALMGLLRTKLLSTQFSLQAYGTYSQAMLLVSTVASLTILGLTDATNYFYNAADSEENKEKHIATVFGIQFIVGLVSGGLICALALPITRYFDNPDLRRLLYLAAWMPVMENLIPMLQVLFISIGKAKLIAVRNFAVSVLYLAIVAAASFVTKDVQTIIVLMLALDILQVVYFFCAFAKNRFPIRLKNFRAPLVKPILSFSVPMTVFVFTSALSRDIDKYVISYFTDTQTLAVYTNAAKVLPFDMLTASLLTVLIPVVTRQVRGENYAGAQQTLKAYLRAGYLITWIFVAGAIVTAKETLLFFYDEKYLPGLGVFVVYLFVDLVRFANMSLILSAKGKTKTLMNWAIISLAVNLVLNIAAFQCFGIIGPALTTLLITVGLMAIFLSKSAGEIGTSLRKLFDWREIGALVAQLLVLGGAAYGVKRLLYLWISSHTAVLVPVYGSFVAAMLLLNRKRLLDCLKAINQCK